MTPLIVLYFIPIGLIAIVIIAIIRLIIRASSGSSNQHNYTQYRQPPPPPGQQNPGTNPYAQQNPYVNSPPDLNQNPQQQPPSWQNPGTTPQPPNYTQPDYTQQTYTPPNYNQPNYNQPNYTQPNYTQPNYTGDTKRSTSIGNTNYSTYAGAPAAPKSNKTAIIVISIIAVVVIAIGSLAYIGYQRSSGAGSLVTEYGFQLAYENPTENTYYLVLDEWDTIKVEPYTSSDDLNYTHRRDRTQFHWQMFTADMNLIADTTVSEDEMESWTSGKNYDSWGECKVLFNPSRTDYVYYTAWFDEIGIDYMGDFEVGDSTYFADAYVVNEAFIFDERDNEFVTDLASASDESTLEQNQFLVNRYDFVVLYEKLNNNNSLESKLDDYRDELVNLFEFSKEEVMANSEYDVDDVNTCYTLDSLIPGYVDEYSTAHDFLPAIEFVRDHASLFKSTARYEYDYIIDSADAIMEYREPLIDAAAVSYMPMRSISYYVREEGILADEPKREVSYETDRDTENASYY